MLDPDEVREQELTPDEVIDQELVGPDDFPTEAYWPDYFDDYPEEQPGDDAWLDEDDDGEPVLCWTDGDVEVELRCLEFGDWEARISIPEEIGRHIPKPVAFKAHHPPTLGDNPVGFVEEIEYKPPGSYTAAVIVLRLAEAEGMPVAATRIYVEDLQEFGEESAEHAERLERALDAAHENEADGGE